MNITIKKPDERKVRQLLNQSDCRYAELSRGDDPTPFDDPVGWMFNALFPGVSILSGHIAISSDKETKKILEDNNIWFHEW